MIVVSIELWPGGDHSNPKLLSAGAIINDGTGSQTLGNYDAAFEVKGQGVKYTARIENHYRGTGVLELLKKVVNALEEVEEDE
jgi:hypothetical protein